MTSPWHQTLVLCIVLLATVQLQPCTAAEVDVYLLAGQSNMRGMGKVVEIAEQAPEQIPNAFTVWRGQAHPLSLGLSSDDKKAANKPFGPEIGFALELATTEHPVYLIKFAANGMPLHPGWSGNTWRGTDPLTSGTNFYPGTTPEDANKGTLYSKMLDQFTSQIAALSKAGNTPVVRGFV